MKSTHLLFAVTLLATLALTATQFEAFSQARCGAWLSNCYKARCSGNRIYTYECCDGKKLYYNSNDCVGSYSSADCVEACWTEPAGPISHCGSPACGFDEFQGNRCDTQACGSGRVP